MYNIVVENIAVMKSVSSKQCEQIASGKQTVIVAKSAPKLQTPFKYYIYCTKEKQVCHLTGCDISYFGCGKVIGEFVCDKIEDYYCATYGKWVEEYDKDAVWVPQNQLFKIKDKNEYKAVVFERNDKYLDTGISTESLKEIGLSAQELFNYVGGLGKHLYAWHISDLKIYDKPKELKEFKKKCLEVKNGCENCKYSVNDELPFAEISIGCERTVTEPPKPWYYVEELK